jgi:hypothetical protein
MSYKFENTIGGQLFEELKQATDNCIEYKGKSLTEWKAELCVNEERAIQQQKKIEYEKKRQENLKSYCDQADKLRRYDSLGQFTDLADGFDRSEMHIDEDAQYRSAMAFTSALQIDMEN